MIPAAAQDEQITSAYSHLRLESECRMVRPQTEGEGEGAEFWCEGYMRIPVRVVEGDLRFFLGYGLEAAEQCSSRQTLGPFNTIGTTLEWRLIREFPGHMTPIATILRYRTDADGRQGEYLVVTKLGRTEACHMAYVDVRASKDANVLARVAADRYAQGFDCARDEPFVMTREGPSEAEIPGTGGCR